MTMAGFQSLSPTGLRKRKSFDRGDDESEALSWEDMSISGHGDATMGQVDGRLERKSPDGDGSSKLCKAGWTDEEDSIVHVAVRALGTQWQAVADRLPGESHTSPRRIARARPWRSRSHVCARHLPPRQGAPPMP